MFVSTAPCNQRGTIWERTPPTGRGRVAISNLLLAALSPETRLRFLQRSTRVPLKRNQILQERNLPIRHAYFIERGTASVIANSGRQIALEVRSLGSWDFVGIPVILGTNRSPHRYVVQTAGEAISIPAGALAEAMRDMADLRAILLTYIQTALIHTTQVAVCNSHHSLNQGLARWLLFNADQTRSDEIEITYMSLSKALGVRRAGITTAIGALQKTGVVASRRARVRILNRKELEVGCCGCYRSIRAAHTRFHSPTGPSIQRAQTYRC